MSQTPFTPAESKQLLVADSFRGRFNPVSGHVEVRGFERHVERFSAAVINNTDLTHNDLSDFVEHSRTLIDEYGEGFPRLELWLNAGITTPSLSLQLRPLPAITESIAMKSVVGFNRITPETKGPNISRFSELNSRLGAEALLVDDDGGIIEGSTTSIMCVPKEVEVGSVQQLFTIARKDRVWSITEALLAEIVSDELGWDVIEADLRLSDCSQYEMWAVNALHGLRRVSSVDGVAQTSHHLAAFSALRDLLDRTFSQIIA